MSVLALVGDLIGQVLSQDIAVWAQLADNAGGASTTSKVIRALLLIGMIAFLWKPAMYMLKHGPKGSAKEWFGVSQIMLGVVLLVVLMIFIVRAA